MSFSGDASRPTPRRVITQATFDDVVRENMEEFGMDRASAAQDAVSQFSTADLSGVVTDGSDAGAQPVVGALRALAAAVAADAAVAATDPVAPAPSSSAPPPPSARGE